MPPLSATSAHCGAACWWRERQLWWLLAIASVLYLVRLTTQPICGEESRWANGAAEMIASGDWVVPRQQGDVFPERPPLGSWAIAAVALVTGRMDTVAVRLPSVLAMLAILMVVYGYGRTFLQPLGALGAAAALASSGQVLVLGRLGESEALFTCLLGSALLVWHWGYVTGRPRWQTWVAAYLLAALAALDKGMQAPVYLATASVAFLALTGDWRCLLSWQHLAGLATFGLVVGAWQVPFWHATDWQSVADIWSGLAADRFSLEGLGTHMLRYPWETFGCLLPWSPLLAAYLFPRFRRTLAGCRPQVTFLVTALAVTYPSVWLSAGARGRYFMPLYPCLALLIGAVVQSWGAGAADSLERWAWRWFLRVIGIVAAIGALILLAVNLLPLAAVHDFHEPLWLAIGFSIAALVHAWILWSHGTSSARPYRRAWLERAAGPGRRLTPDGALLVLAAFLGLAYVGPVLNLRLNKSNDLAPALTALRLSLPAGEQLVSFGPIAHRFAYFYGVPIEQLAWPESEDELPPGVTYFCYDHHRGDGSEKRLNGRGRKWNLTSAALPFAWEPIGLFPVAPLLGHDPDTLVVVGRRLAPEEEETGLASRTQPARGIK